MTKGARLAMTVFLLFLSSLAHAEEGLPKEPIVVNGDKVEYFHEKKEATGSGNVSITYKDVLLTCDEIKVRLDTREAEASGNVKVTQKGAYFTGEKIVYNFDTREGRVVNGCLDANPFYGKAREVDKIANKDQVNLERGYVTTCDLEKPHYRIQSRRVKIYLDDKVTASHILFFIGNVPVLYLPYYEQPLDDDKTNFTVTPGESKDWGYYALTSYRYYLNDKNRGDLLLDYRSKRGLAEGVNHYYDTGKMGLGDGSFKFYYTHDNDNLAYRPSGEVRSRYRYQVRHRWDLGGDTDTTATMEFNKLSDKDVIKDYFYNEYEELGEIPDNYVSFLTQKRDYTTEFLARKRFDKFYTVVERLPEYKIDILNYRIGDIPLYYSANASGVYLNKAFESAIPEQKDVNIIRFDAYNWLSYAARIFRSLSVTPYGGMRETYFSRNKWGETNQVRTIYDAGIDSSIKFYKVYNVKSDFLGLDINSLRHIITPTANYYFTHQPTISPDCLNQFDAIDALDTQNGVRLGIENRLQTKRLQGDQMKSVDLATLIVSTDYMFRMKKDNWGLKSDKFKSVDIQLELVPYSWAYLLSKVSVNTKKYIIETAGTDLVATHGDEWSLAVGQRYENTETGSTNLFTMDGWYKINDKWKVRAYERMNTEKRAFEEQEYTIYRDLHCWVAELTFNYKSRDDMGLWVIFRLKAFPSYPIGLRRTYSRPRFGAVGE